MFKKLLSFAAALLAFVTTEAMAETKHQHGHAAGASAGDTACKPGQLKCASVVTPAFAADGTLWIVFSAGGIVSVQKSSDFGMTFAAPVAVHRAPLPLDNGPDARPKLVVTKNGSLFVTFATRDEKYNGTGFIARSTDGGATFSDPAPIAADSPSQRFETATVTGDGRLFAAWIDKRNAAAARKDGKTYAGAALAVSSADAGSTAFKSATIARDNTCECCRIALAVGPTGSPAVVFRNIFDGGVRDHAFMSFENGATSGTLMRVSNDAWATDACPHHGPSLAIASDGSIHVMWFTAGQKRKGVFYASSRDAGRTFSEPIAIGTAGKQISRPSIVARGTHLAMAWKEFDGDSTEVRAMTSKDGGATWGNAWSVARTPDDSDHPQLVAHGAKTYLSWQTKQDGYRLIALEQK
jgi:hypothetical protein